MTTRILVTYASKYGATAEIAETIGAVLTAAGLRVNVLPVDQVYDLTPFSAVVLGSAVYNAHWCEEAIAFLEVYGASLARVPVWLFSCGALGKGDPIALMNGWRFPTDLKTLAHHIHPQDIAYFNGALDLEKLNFAEKQTIKESQSPIGDFRDWTAISEWAASIVTEFLPKTNQGTG